MSHRLILLLPFIMFACNSRQTDTGNVPVITVSVLPQKYFIEQIAGDLVEVNVMIPPGASPATYEPTVLQLQNLKNSMAYMRIGYVGFELTWLDKIQSVNREMPVIDLSIGVELISEESHHGDQSGEQTGDQSGDPSGDQTGDHHSGIDPHIWLSPKNAGIIAKNIYDALADHMPEKRETLYENYKAFLERRDSLDNYIRDELKLLKNRGFICYHPSLSYYAKDYNLQQHPMELEGKTPTSAHLKRLTDLGNKENINVILLQKQFDQHNAEVLAKEIGAEIVLIDPLDPEWYDQMIYITDRLKAGTDE